mmetsp:Transcript_4708/g.11570  ORF Transcript_4708/g.11570 Transcript_4708/m.11570 type:complete len:663 (-) Transcript_4708:429-2417(-)
MAAAALKDAGAGSSGSSSGPFGGTAALAQLGGTLAAGCVLGYSLATLKSKLSPPPNQQRRTAVVLKGPALANRTTAEEDINTPGSFSSTTRHRFNSGLATANGASSAVPETPPLLERTISRRNSGNAFDMLNNLSEETATAINAFEMTAEKNADHAFLLYSLYGIYFYPGYLYNRFSERRNHVAKLERLASLLGKKYLEASKYAALVQEREELLASYHSPNAAKWLAYRKEDVLDAGLLECLKKLTDKMQARDLELRNERSSNAALLLNGGKNGGNKKMSSSREDLTADDVVPSSLSSAREFNKILKYQLVDSVAAGTGTGKRGPRGNSRSCIKEIAEEVYRFPVLKQEICEELLEEIELFLQWQAEQLRRKVPGSELLNTKLCVLDHLNEIGPHLLDLLKTAVVDPLMTLLYPSVSQNTSFEGKLLYNQGAAADHGGNSTMLSREDILMATDYRYGFSIGYSPDGAGAGRSGDPAPGQGDYHQRNFTSGTGNTSAVGRLSRAAEARGKSLNISRVGLDCHTDDSEISLTIRLGKEYSGGAVGLRWKVSDAREGELQTKILQSNGEGTLFYGQQFHEVEAVTGGERQMLVVWFRGESHFRTNTCPCCRMNRRFDPNCILTYDASLKDHRSPLRESRAGSQEDELEEREDEMRADGLPRARTQ